MLNKISKVKKGSKNFYDPRRRFFTSKYIYFLMYQMKTFAKSNLEKIYTYNHQKNGVEGFSSVGKSIGNILKRSESLAKGVGGKRY